MTTEPTKHGDAWWIAMFAIVGASAPVLLIGTLYWIRLAESGFPPKDVAQDIERFPGVVFLPSAVCMIVFALAAKLACDSGRNQNVSRTLIVIAGVTALVAWLTIPSPRFKGDSEGVWKEMLVFTGPIAGYFLARLFVLRENSRLPAETTNTTQQGNPSKPSVGH